MILLEIPELLNPTLSCTDFNLSPPGKKTTW